MPPRNERGLTFAELAELNDEAYDTYEFWDYADDYEYDMPDELDDDYDG